jgi:hypothetical protein
MSTAAAGVPTTTTINVVRPLSGRGETVAFICAVALLIGSTVGYTLLHPRNDNVQQLLSYQISSFDGLEHVDQSIHSALLPAVDEIIWNNNTTGGWSLIADLEKSHTPPFYKDVFWRANGEMRWQAVLPGATDTKKAAPTAESVHQEPGAPPHAGPGCRELLRIRRQTAWTERVPGRHRARPLRRVLDQPGRHLGPQESQRAVPETDQDRSPDPGRLATGHPVQRRD